MRAVQAFQKSQARLRMEGCCYRLRQVSGSPFAYVYELTPPRHQQAVTWCPVHDEGACEQLLDLLLLAGKERAAGGKGLDWGRLKGPRQQAPAAPPRDGLTWGEIRQAIQADIAPGGPKGRDRNPFVCFRDKGFFGLMYGDSLVALPEHLESFCLYTPDSIRGHQDDPDVPLEPREYNSKGFYQVIQMVNYLAKKGIGSRGTRQRSDHATAGTCWRCRQRCLPTWISPTPLLPCPGPSPLAPRVAMSS